ncbi:hypothetical protein Trydic_g20019, partial [Trypoxylus dichotomus]
EGQDEDLRDSRRTQENPSKFQEGRYWKTIDHTRAQPNYRKTSQTMGKPALVDRQPLEKDEEPFIETLKNSATI